MLHRGPLPHRTQTTFFSSLSLFFEKNLSFEFENLPEFVFWARILMVFFFSLVTLFFVFFFFFFGVFFFSLVTLFFVFFFFCFGFFFCCGFSESASQQLAFFFFFFFFFLRLSFFSLGFDFFVFVNKRTNEPKEQHNK